MTLHIQTHTHGSGRIMTATDCLRKQKLWKFTTFCVQYVSSKVQATSTPELFSCACVLVRVFCSSSVFVVFFVSDTKVASGLRIPCALPNISRYAVHTRSPTPRLQKRMGSVRLIYTFAQSWTTSALCVLTLKILTFVFFRLNGLVR